MSAQRERSGKHLTRSAAGTPSGDGSKTKERVRLNNKIVEALGPGMVWDADPKTVGFGVRCHPGGGKSFFVDYRIDGRQRRITIGKFPQWSADAARERAKEIRKLIDRGHDPAGSKRERREAATVQDLIDRYVEDHLPTKSQEAARVADEKRMLVEIGKRLGVHTKVADVHGGDIAEMHRKIGELIGRGGTPRKVRGDPHLTVCSKMFSLSLVPRVGETLPWRNAVLGNPCKGVQKNHEEERERFFSAAELAAISDALNEYPGVAADCMRLIMLTGCQPSEALKATWQEFDSEPGYWIKPSAHVKQRKTHKLLLSPAAIELVDRLRSKGKGKGKWVFPGDKAGEHIAALWHVWHFVRARTGLGPDARLYDLRHTFASVGAGGGLSLPIIGRLLGHTQPRTTARYAHLADDPVREAAEKITTVITGGREAERSSCATAPRETIMSELRPEPSWSIWDPERPVIAQWAIWNALEDNPTTLLTRLRDGTATHAEMACMADLYETVWRQKHPVEAVRKDEILRSLEPDRKQQFYETKPRRLRHANLKKAAAKPGDPTRFVNQAMAQLVLVMVAADGLSKREAIIATVAKTFGVSPRHVYNKLEEFGDTVLQVEQLRAADVNLQLMQRWYEQLGAFDRTMRLGFIDQVAAARANFSQQES